MISPILPDHDADTIVLDFDVFLAEQARRHRVSQPVIIAALLPHIIPPQPDSPQAPAADSPASQAPGAKTDGEGSSSLASPSVDPFPGLRELAQMEAMSSETIVEVEPVSETRPDTAEQPTNAAQVRAQTATGRGAVRVASVEPSPEPRNVHATADLHGSDVATSKAASDKTAEPLGSAAPSKKPRTIGRKDEVARVHREHPDWHIGMVAEHLGVLPEYVTKTGARLGIHIPTRTEHRAAEKAKTTKALKAASASAKQPPTPAKLQSPPEPQPVSRAVALPPVQRDTADVLHRLFRPASSTRFYLRDASGRYVHQSLDPSPTDTGPLMTEKRVYAWFDNAHRFKGAAKKWPELASMRKEAPQP
jgi:hypothetical protein